MKKFNEFYKEQTTVGLVELIDINGIGQFKAKVDSGNSGYNVIHGTNIEELPDNKVKFLTADNKTVSFKKHGDIDIHVGSTEEKRPVILLNFKLGSQFYQDIPFSVADRSKNEEKVLIGEPFLKKLDAVIDVNKEQLHEARMLPLQDQLQETTQKMEGLYKEMEPYISELEQLNELPNIPFDKIAKYNKVLNIYYKELQGLKAKRDRLSHLITFGFQDMRKSALS